MLRIGLTGGIGSGKSTVATMFAALGVPIIDADLIAHQLLDSGGAAVPAVLAAFGPEINDRGHIDRRRLAHIVFSDPERRRELESILHPLIRARMRAASDELASPYCILVIPLLIETGQHDLVDRVLLIDADERTRIGRVRERDGRSDAEISAIIGAQADRSRRLAAADDIISNDGDLATLRIQVEGMHVQYLAMAGGATVSRSR